MTKQFTQIVFLNEWELPDDFFTWSAENQFEYLSQWDYGDYHEFIEGETNHDIYADVYIKNGYTMQINSSFGYAELTLEIKE